MLALNILRNMRRCRCALTVMCGMQTRLAFGSEFPTLWIGQVHFGFSQGQGRNSGTPLIAPYDKTLPVLKLVNPMSLQVPKYKLAPSHGGATHAPQICRS
jgi:hypothetical protein